MHSTTKYSDSDSDADGAPLGFGSQYQEEPSSLTLPKISRSNFSGDNEKSYLTISPQTLEHASNASESHTKLNQTISFASLVAAIGTPEAIIQKGSEHLLIFLSNTYRLLWVSLVVLATLYFYPLISTMFLGGLVLIIFGGQRHDDKPSHRTAKWTVTGFSYQMKDGFLASPSILDKSGQWRLVIKQRKGMDGVLTTFGLLCTDIYPDIEVVTARVKFECTTPCGQQIQTGGMNNLEFKYDYYCAGDCAFSRPVRLSRKNLGDDETIMLHCTFEFYKKSVNFLKMLAGNIRDANGSTNITRHKKGKNVVAEHGTIYAGDLEFQDDDNFPIAFRSMLKFVHHSHSRTFVWEIPAFTTLLENSEVWGIFSPQFFLISHDICSIWRMKLMEVQGVFRLHVQLRGLPTAVKQVKLWYLLHLVDNFGDSVIPEHAVSRVKYPDHMNLWDTTRHILYRRETILERFVTSSGGLTLRITLQMQPNDMTLMEVDSDEWITSKADFEQLTPQLTSGTLGNQQGSIEMQKRPMLTN